MSIDFSGCQCLGATDQKHLVPSFQFSSVQFCVLPPPELRAQQGLVKGKAVNNITLISCGGSFGWG